MIPLWLIRSAFRPKWILLNFELRRFLISRCLERWTTTWGISKGLKFSVFAVKTTYRKERPDELSWSPTSTVSRQQVLKKFHQVPYYRHFRDTSISSILEILSRNIQLRHQQLVQHCYPLHSLSYPCLTTRYVIKGSNDLYCCCYKGWSFLSLFSTPSSATVFTDLI